MPTAELLRTYAAAHERAVFFDVSAYGKIELTERDAVLFLHNLCTNDIKNLAVGGSCEAFLCTMKARTIAHFMVNRTKDGLLLDMVPGLAEKVLKHLDKHLISEQVEITDRTNELGLLRIAGPEARTIAAKDAWPNPLLGLPACDIICPRADVQATIDTLLSAGAVVGSPELHEILRIEAGTPEYFKDMDDERFVMEVGRTAQAICFTKGCYLGQEPIVMARDRGHVNRTLMGIKVASEGSEPADICPGSKLFQGETEVGVATSSAWSPGLHQAIALAYLRRGSQESGMELTIEPGRDGRKALVAALPFVS